MNSEIDTVRESDVLAVTSGVIVHGCNAQGVMGSGVAKQVKKLYPEVYNAYKFDIDHGATLGDIIPVQVGDDKWIVNAITQKFYGNDGRKYVDYDAVRLCFRRLRKFVETLPPPISVHFPKIGCGLGGGDWNIVSKIIKEELPDHLKYLHLDY